MKSTRPVRDAHGRPFDLDDLLRSCIHCGLCLNTCPTYRLTGDEAESPRGRLILLASVLGEDTEPVDRGPIDRCLGCLGCETTCPSGVPYGHLLEEGRRRLGPSTEPGPTWVRWMVETVLTHPRRLAVAARLGSLLRSVGVGAWLPASLRPLLEALPHRTARWPRMPRPASDPSEGPCVALLAGCAQSVFTPEVLAASVDLVRAAGGRPWVPPGQGCCGALDHHQGSAERARELARRTVETFEGAQALLVPSAGCSAHLRHLEDAVGDDPTWRRRAAALASRTRDLVEWLDERRLALDFRSDRRRVAYHPPCHHLHAQGLDGPAQRLLGRVGELELVPVARRELCCGSAGAWSLQFPELASRRREQKLDDLLEPRPDLLLTSNPGCELFLDSGLVRRGRPVEIEHLVVYLARRLVQAAPPAKIP